MENNIFTYQYSAQRNKEVESIRKKYLPRETNKLEQLKKLDMKVQTAGQLPSLCVGIVGALIFGLGLCFGLGALNGADWLSVLFAIIGTAIMLPAYPIYRYVEKKTRTELTPEILRLSDEILKS